MKVLKNKIILDKEMNNLDKFLSDFVNVIKKHTPYVIVSGYVSILFGRSRTTEDIDLIVPALNYKKFNTIYKDLNNNNFWCLNAENPEEIYNNYLKKQNAVRFARKKKMIPNIEFKFAKTKVDNMALKNAIKVEIKKHIINVSNIELQIAFKEIVLGSQKDIEDARHLEKLFEDNLDDKKLKKYRSMLKNA